MYLSRPTFSFTQNSIQDEIGSILNKARKNNPELEITGCLMFTNKCFLQVLEGPPEKVQTIFEQISADPRHHDIVIVDRHTIESRRFNNWSMALIENSQSNETAMNEILGGSYEHITKVSVNKIIDFMEAALSLNRAAIVDLK